MTETNQELERVGLNINQVLVAYWKLKMQAADRRFTATELRQFVQHHNFGTAPASADRVLRTLRQKGKINYVVVNRAKSLYEATECGVPADAKN